MDGLLQVCWSVEDLYSNSQKSGDERLLLSASLAYVLMKRLGFDREAEIHAEQTLTDEMIRSVKEVPMQEISDISREILNGIQDYVQKGKGRGQAFPLESAMQRVQEYANAAARQEKGAVEVGASPAPPAPQAATVEPSTVAAEVAKEDMYFYHPESESFWMMKAGEEIRHGIDYESSERISKEEYEAKKLNPVRSWQEISSVEAPATEVASATVGEAAPEEAGASSEPPAPQAATVESSTVAALEQGELEFSNSVIDDAGIQLAEILSDHTPGKSFYPEAEAQRVVSEMNIPIYLHNGHEWGVLLAMTLFLMKCRFVCVCWMMTV